MKKPRKTAEVVRALRTALENTQQDFAVRMGWSIATIVRYEAGAKPNVQALAQMMVLAQDHGLDDLAAELRMYLNVGLGPAFPITPNEQVFVLLARRIHQNPKRHAAFLQFALPELQQLKQENLIRKDYRQALDASMDALGERMKRDAE